MKIVRNSPALRNLKLAIAGLNSTEGKVGWFESAKYPGGQPVGGIAAVHEFGSASRGIPPRLGMRETFDLNKGKFAETAKTISKLAARGDIAPENVMEAVTQAAAGEMRAHITKIQEPALKEATVEARVRRLAKGGKPPKGTIEKPLVDTGILLNTLSAEVTKK